MKARALLLAAAVSAAGAWLGFACSAEPGAAPAGGAGAGGLAASGGSGGSAAASVGGSPAGAAGTAGLSGVGGWGCDMPGWAPPPVLGSGPSTVCIPDDPAARVPHLKWKAGGCPGCQIAETPWNPDGYEKGEYTVVGGVSGAGPEPSLLRAAIRPGPESIMSIIYDIQGVPRAAWYEDRRTLGHRVGTRLDPTTGSLLVHYSNRFNMDQLTVVGPATQSAEVMRATEPSLLWPGSFVGTTGINNLWFSNQWVAMDRSGRVALGNLNSGEVFWAQEQAGLPTGTYGYGAVIGDAPFVSYRGTNELQWYVYREGSLQHFMGGPGKWIWLAGQGDTLAWAEGTEPYLDGTQTRYARVAAYAAPFTTDGAQLQPRLLLDQVPHWLSFLVVANGHLTAIYDIDPGPGRRLGVVVVRLSDGRAYRSELPDNQTWGFYNYPTETELWGTVSRAAEYGTFIRVPYASMEVLQEAAP